MLLTTQRNNASMGKQCEVIMNASKKIIQIVLLSIIFATVIPRLLMAQQDILKVSQDSFPKTIHFLSTAYLEGMQNMSNQTSIDLSRMSLSLAVSIAEMLNDNEKNIQRTTFQLNREVYTQLIPEMKTLCDKVLLMNHQLAMQFKQ